MSSVVYDCIILGGGASGLFAASMLTNITSGKANILIIDGNERCGKKLAMTGSGSAVFGVFRSPAVAEKAYRNLSSRYRTVFLCHTQHDSMRVTQE